MCSEAEDAGGLTPAKDDNEAARHFIPRTLPILDCVDYISSWAGVCPGNHKSAGKRNHGKTTKGNKTLKSILVECAKSARNVKGSYFSAQYQRIAARRGKNRAAVAVAHSMLIAIYHVLKYGVPFRDLGADYYNSFNREHKIRGYLKRLQALGWVPDSPALGTNPIIPGTLLVHTFKHPQMERATASQLRRL